MSNNAASISSDRHTYPPASAAAAREEVMLMDEPLISRDEFERAYAERSNLTAEELRALGRVVVRCRCEAEECEGWASVSEESAKDYAPGGIYGPRS